MLYYIHDAPMGWSYSLDCCSTSDCRQVDDATVKEDAIGYTVTIDGKSYFVPYRDQRIRQSGDEFKHVCYNGYRVICIYVPSRGT